MQQIQQLSHCIEPNLRMALTNLVEHNVHTHHCTEIFEDRVFEPAPTPYAREYSRAVSTRVAVVLYAPVNVLDGSNEQGGP